MPLADSVILKELKRGNIIIEPFIVEHLNPNSVDLTLSAEYKCYNILTSGHLDCKQNNQTTTFVMPEEGTILQPNKLYLYSCNEKIGVPCNGKKSISEYIFGRKYLRAKVEGKSSIGRLGCFIHVTAGFIDTGFAGSLVLEMVVAEPLRVYPNQKICQLEFERVEGKVLVPYGSKSGSKYMNQQGVQASKMHENFK